jgi:hypothetical protein
MKRSLLLAGFLVFASALTVRAEEGKHPLLGTWKQVSVNYTGQWQDAPKEVTMYKHVTDSNFNWVQFDNQTKQIVAGAGGRCAVTDDAYIEHIEYALGPVSTLLGKKQEFKWQVDGNKWRMSGTLSNGQSIEEIFERVPVEVEDSGDEPAEKDDNAAGDRADDPTGK